MKERLTSLHAADVEAMKKHYEELVDGLKEERKQQDQLMAEKDKTVEYERKESERGKAELKTVIEQRDRQIAELKHRLAATG
jgi:hypothetical protein